MHESEYFNIARCEPIHWWYAGMRAAAAGWLRRLPASVGTPPLLLDAGCGTGGGLRWLAEFGRTCGADLHPLALRLAARDGRTPLLQADIRTLPFADRSFSAITSFEALCQLPRGEDVVALREFVRVLHPGGWLLLRLPAHEWLRGPHDDFVHTRHRYSRGEVQAKLRGVGLQPMRTSYANAALFLPVALRRLLQRWAARPAASDLRMPSRFLNFLLSAWLRGEAAWLRRFNFPFGLSVLALARKTPA